MGRRPGREAADAGGAWVFRRSRNGLRPLPCPLLKSPPNAAARPLEKQEAGLISKPLKIRYHSVV